MKTFREAIQLRDFVITAELNLSRETDKAAVVEQATILAAHTDAIQLPDSPNARVQMTPLTISNVLLQNGIEVIPHLSCRDRNRVALESELLSLGVMGVTSVLLLRGDALPEDHRPRVKQVFELGGKDLIEAACALACRRGHHGPRFCHFQELFFLRGFKADKQLFVRLTGRPGLCGSKDAGPRDDLFQRHTSYPSLFSSPYS